MSCRARVQPAARPRPHRNSFTDRYQRGQHARAASSRPCAPWGTRRRGTAGDGCVRVRRPARRRAHTGGGHRLTAVRAAQLPQVAAAVSPGVACGRWMIAAHCSAPWSSTTTRPAACCSSPYPGVQQLAPSPQPGQHYRNPQICRVFLSLLSVFLRALDKQALCRVLS